MSLWRRLTGPGNALILLSDHLTSATAPEWEEQVKEVARYYRFVKLGDLVEAAEKNQAHGLASVAFEFPRKSAMLRAVPFLRGENIPVTFFLTGDGIGMNRLPSTEELQLYRESYPAAFSDELYARLQETAWEDPVGLDERLLAFRREIGPLPLETIDPMRFFSTWGKLVEIPPAEREFGFHLTYHPRHEALLSETLPFLERQTGQPLRVALSRQSFEGFEKWGFTGVVGTRKGAVKTGVSLGDLPVWDFSSTISE